jgi:hypothetical protein
MKKKLIEKQLGWIFWKYLREQLDGKIVGSTWDKLWFKLCVGIEWKIKDEIERRFK